MLIFERGSQRCIIEPNAVMEATVHDNGDVKFFARPMSAIGNLLTLLS